MSEHKTRLLRRGHVCFFVVHPVYRLFAFVLTAVSFIFAIDWDCLNLLHILCMVDIGLVEEYIGFVEGFHALSFYYSFNMIFRIYGNWSGLMLTLISNMLQSAAFFFWCAIWAATSIGLLFTLKIVLFSSVCVRAEPITTAAKMIKSMAIANLSPRKSTRFCVEEKRSRT